MITRQSVPAAAWLCQRRRSRAASSVLLMVAVLFLAGCGATASPREISGSPLTTSAELLQLSSPPPDATDSSEPSGSGAFSAVGGTVTVHGTASWGGRPVAGVVVGFQKNGCSSCGLHSAQTDESGAYVLALPAADYLVSCAVKGGTCSPDTSDGVSADLTDDSEVDLVIGTGGAAATDGSGDGGTGAQDAGGDGSGTSTQQPILSGHVHDTSGRPVAGAEIIVSPPDATGGYQVDSDASGYYAIGDENEVPVGRVQCEYMASPYATCSPDSGHQVVFDVNSGPQVVNWTVSG